MRLGGAELPPLVLAGEEWDSNFMAPTLWRGLVSWLRGRLAGSFQACLVDTSIIAMYS